MGVGSLEVYQSPGMTPCEKGDHRLPEGFVAVANGKICAIGSINSHDISIFL